MALVVITLFVALATASSIYVVYRLIALPEDGLGASNDGSALKTEQELEELRLLVLSLRSDLGELRRASLTRSAENGSTADPSRQGMDARDDALPAASQHEIGALRSVVLLLRNELAELRRSSSTRDADVRRMLGDVSGRLRWLEERVERVSHAEVQTEISDRELDLLVFGKERRASG